MSFSYNTSLPTALDKVRFYTVDTISSTAVFTNEEITTLLSAYNNNHFLVAAHLLTTLQTRLSTTNKTGNLAGVIEKKLENVTVRWGIDSSSAGNLQSVICWLREQGARLMAGNKFRFRVFG